MKSLCIFYSSQAWDSPARCGLKRGSCKELMNETVADLRVLKYIQSDAKFHPNEGLGD